MTFLLLSIYSVLVSTSNLPPCEQISNEDGSLVFRLREMFYHMLYPETFVVELNAGSRCSYVANQMVQAQWFSKKLTAKLYAYGFDGYDGKDKNTCKLAQEINVNPNKKYYTAFHQLEMLRNPRVCQYVVMLDNTKGT